MTGIRLQHNAGTRSQIELFVHVIIIHSERRGHIQFGQHRNSPLGVASQNVQGIIIFKASVDGFFRFGINGTQFISHNKTPQIIGNEIGIFLLQFKKFRSVFK